MLLLLLLDAQVKVHAFGLLCFFSETGCASSGYKFDSCGILKETGEKLFSYEFFLLIQDWISVGGGGNEVLRGIDSKAVKFWLDDVRWRLGWVTGILVLSG